ncbi:MAG: hypothetical protein LBO73_04290 [Holosporaceae bacterium]|jgi:hypothetical protein|nr:hypothetical protein [Holosporaceae bacterium]
MFITYSKRAVRTILAAGFFGFITTVDAMTDPQPNSQHQSEASEDCRCISITAIDGPGDEICGYRALHPTAGKDADGNACDDVCRDFLDRLSEKIKNWRRDDISDLKPLTIIGSVLEEIAARSADISETGGILKLLNNFDPQNTEYRDLRLLANAIQGQSLGHTCNEDPQVSRLAEFFLILLQDSPANFSENPPEGNAYGNALEVLWDSEFIRNTTLNFLDLLRISRNRMQFYRYNRGIADAIACMQGKHLLLIEGRKIPLKGSVTHRFEHPDREDIPEDAADTIFVIQQSDDHYVKGVRSNPPPQDADIDKDITPKNDRSNDRKIEKGFISFEGRNICYAPLPPDCKNCGYQVMDESKGPNGNLILDLLDLLYEKSETGAKIRECVLDEIIRLGTSLLSDLDSSSLGNNLMEEIYRFESNFKRTPQNFLDLFISSETDHLNNLKEFVPEGILINNKDQNGCSISSIIRNSNEYLLNLSGTLAEYAAAGYEASSIKKRLKKTRHVNLLQTYLILLVQTAENNEFRMQCPVKGQPAGVVDAIAHMQGKHLLILEGKKSLPDSADPVLHRYKHPDRTDTPEEAEDTLYLIRTNDRCYVKGIPGKDSDVVSDEVPSPAAEACGFISTVDDIIRLPDGQCITTIGVPGDGNCGYSSMHPDAGKNCDARESFLDLLWDQIRNHPDSDKTLTIIGYILEEITARSAASSGNENLLELIDKNNKDGAYGNIYLLSDIIKGKLYYKEASADILTLARQIEQIQAETEAAEKPMLVRLLLRCLLDSIKDSEDTIDTILRDGKIIDILAKHNNLPEFFSHEPKDDVWNNIPKFFGPEFKDAPKEQLQKSIDTLRHQISGIVDLCSEIQSLNRLFNENPSASALAELILTLPQNSSETPSAPDDYEKTLKKLWSSEFIRNTIPEFLDFLLISREWMQFYPSHRGIADAIACMRGKHLLLIEGRNNHQQGQILHRFKHPDREDIPEDAVDTIFVVQQSDVHYIKGVRCSLSPQDAEITPESDSSSRKTKEKFISFGERNIYYTLESDFKNCGYNTLDKSKGPNGNLIFDLLDFLNDDSDEEETRTQIKAKIKEYVAEEIVRLGISDSVTTEEKQNFLRSFKHFPQNLFELFILPPMFRLNELLKETSDQLIHIDNNSGCEISSIIESGECLFRCSKQLIARSSYPLDNLKKSVLKSEGLIQTYLILLAHSADDSEYRRMFCPPSNHPKGVVDAIAYMQGKHLLILEGKKSRNPVLHRYKHPDRTDTPEEAEDTLYLIRINDRYCVKGTPGKDSDVVSEVSSDEETFFSDDTESRSD